MSETGSIPGSGTIEVTVNAASVDFGNAKLDEHVTGPDALDAAKFPTATYTGKFTKFNANGPTEARGTFTLHGVTKPLQVQSKGERAGDMVHLRGNFNLLQSDYGIKPISVAGGALKVKDELKFSFEMVARKQD